MAIHHPFLWCAVGTLAGLLVSDHALAANAPAAKSSSREPWLAPADVVATPDGRSLLIACTVANQIAVFDIESRGINRSIPVPAAPSGLVLSADGRRLYVTCAAPASRVVVLDWPEAKVVATIPAGHTAVSPVLAPDGKTLYVCNRFNNAVGVIDLGTRKETARIAVPREPMSAALTPDGRYLLVANHIHAGRADADVVAASVSVIETAAGKVIKELQLPNGSGLLRAIRVSPDGRYAAVAHVLARFHLPTTQLERGWMNSNALSLIDLAQMQLINTVLLDSVDSGAANPWAVAWTSDNKFICVTHAGTHELSVIDAAALLAKLAKMPAAISADATPDYSASSRIASDVPNDLAFLVDLRQRIHLLGKGPRGLALIGHRAYAVDYFSDTVEVVDLDQQPPMPLSIALGGAPDPSVLRRGEMLFNDASICFQGWQSCSSCHSSDARVDGLNWDLLNDGIGNPKNGKSLLLSHVTPPAMSMGVRDTAETAVRSGIRKILFTVQPEEVPTSLDVWLKSLKPIPSPHLVNGKLSAAAQRGAKLFHTEALGCAVCHKGEHYTDLKSHDVGTRGQYDKPEDRFDTPTLIEIWRTAPYLHDGSALTVREVLTTHNAHGRHGKTSQLTEKEADELTEFLLSL